MPSSGAVPGPDDGTPGGDPVDERASDFFTGPVKRSMTIAGHPSSLSLEPPFWAALEAAARNRKIPLNALVARIDADRVDAGGGANLASVLRCWLLGEARKGRSDSNNDSDTDSRN